MIAFLNYLVEANLGLCLFLIAYGIFLAKETDFQLKRGFMLIAMMGSLTFPLLHLGTVSPVMPSLGNFVPATWLPEVEVYGDGVSAGEVTTSYSIWYFIFMFYSAGVGAFFILFVVRLMRLLVMISRADTSRQDQYIVVESNENRSTFSFFRFIFIGQADRLSPDEKQLIIAHEHVHSKQLHSIDILLVNLLSIAFWFNPFIRIYKKIFIQLHEFEADARAVSNRDVNDYCSLLAKVALLSADFPLANHFNNSLTVKRINMIRTLKSNIRHWKLAAMLALFAGFFIVVACQDQFSSDAVDVAKHSTMAIDLPAKVQLRLDELQQAHPERKFVVLEVDKEGMDKAESLNKKLALNNIDPSMITTVDVYKDAMDSQGTLRNFVIVEYNEQTNIIANQAQSVEQIFTIVEVTAEPSGGMESLVSFLQSNLKYPAESREAGKEGSVFVQFVVNTDGSLSDFTVLKSVDPLLDAEALRVAKSFPNWVPGKQNGNAVRQRFVLPISFKLNSSNTAPELKEVSEDLKVLSTTTERNGEKLVEGKVTDPEGNPLKGVNLVVVGTTKGTTTDTYGNFKLTVPQKGGQIAASFVGYKTHLITF